MGFNINTATNAELKQKCEELNKDFKQIWWRNGEK